MITNLFKKGISYFLKYGKKNSINLASAQKSNNKNSYLLWNTPRGKINSETLGYILPNGNINFASEQNAMIYAKKRVVFALNTENPNEKAIILKGKQVVDEINGSLDTVDFSKYTNDLTDTTLVHGHPEIDGVTGPLSLDDVLFMLTKKLKQITAYNKQGQYSSFRGKALDSAYDECRTVCSKYAKMFSSFAPKEIQSQIEGRIHINLNPLFADIDKAYKALSTPISSQQATEFEKTITNAYLNGSFANAMHHWLKTSAEKIGFRYKTNYSYLK